MSEVLTTSLGTVNIGTLPVLHLSRNPRLTSLFQLISQKRKTVDVRSNIETYSGFQQGALFLIIQGTRRALAQVKARREYKNWEELSHQEDLQKIYPGNIPREKFLEWVRRVMSDGDEKGTLAIEFEFLEELPSPQ